MGTKNDLIGLGMQPELAGAVGSAVNVIATGTATLVAGTVTVANTSVSSSTKLIYARATTGGTVGHLSYTRVAGTSFTINSSSGTETSTVDWLLVAVA